LRDFQSHFIPGTGNISSSEPVGWHYHVIFFSCCVDLDLDLSPVTGKVTWAVLVFHCSVRPSRCDMCFVVCVETKLLGKRKEER